MKTLMEKMMIIVNEDIEKYSMNSSMKPSKLCEEIFDYTVKHVPESQMLIGPLEAGFLQLLVKIIGAQRILEIGCFTGYSALAMAEVLPHDGELITIDMDKGVTETAQEFWSRSDAGKKINLKIGKASEVINTLEGSFDLIFIDADKEGYIDYVKTTSSLLSPNGLIAADNTLWEGKVIDKTTEDADAKAIQQFNEYIVDCGYYDVTLLPLRDGLSLIRKK